MYFCTLFSFRMREYYIAIDGKTLGPMDAAGIKALQPTENTLVWFDGIETWTKIRYIAELTDCIVSPTETIAPPPLPKTTPPPLPEDDSSNKEERPQQQRGKRRDWVKISIIAAITIVAATTIVTTGSLISDKRLRDHLDIQSQRAEQLKREQAETEFQHQLELERQEAERQRQAAEEERQMRLHIEQLRNERQMLESRISECGRRLRKAQEFHFLRTSSEKAHEIKQIIDERNQYMDRVAAINAELKSYGVTN